MSEVTLVKLGSAPQVLEVPDDCTVASLKAIADLNPDLEIRFGGQAVADETPVQAGGTYAATAPSVKHGS